MPGKPTEKTETPPSTMDARRGEKVDAAKGRLKYESVHVQRVPREGSSGRERTLVATYVDGLVIDSGELIVSAVVYDGTRSDVGRPVRLVLDLDDARALIAQLGLWVPALEASPLGNRVLGGSK